MEIIQNNHEKSGKFCAKENEKTAGHLDYTWKSPAVFSIDHTEVDESFAGKGVGRQLVYAAVDYARKNKLHIIPLCPFAKKLFDKTPELRDVLV